MEQCCANADKCKQYTSASLALSRRMSCTRPSIQTRRRKLYHVLCRGQRGRHSTKYTEEMEDKELLADEEGGKDVRPAPCHRGFAAICDEGFGCGLREGHEGP